MSNQRRENMTFNYETQTGREVENWKEKGKRKLERETKEKWKALTKRWLAMR